MEHCSGYSLSYPQLQFQNPYLNIENPSGKLIVRNGRAAPLLCYYGEFKLRPTRGLTFHSPSGQRLLKEICSLRSLLDFSLQYCRFLDVRVLWSACRAEHPSGFSQSSVVVENVESSSSTIWAEKIWSLRFTSFAVACEWVPPTSMRQAKRSEASG